MPMLCVLMKFMKEAHALKLFPIVACLHVQFEMFLCAHPIFNLMLPWR